MSRYQGIIDVMYKGECIETVKRLVVDVHKKDCCVYGTKFYQVLMNYKHGHGLYIDIHKPINFLGKN